MEKPVRDWREIEDKWRAGAKNVALAAEYGISEAYVRKVSKAKGWVRGMPRIDETMPPERVEEVVEKIRTKRRGLRRCKDVAERLLDELDAVTCKLGELDVLVDQATAGDPGSKAADALRQAMSLGERVKTLNTIVGAMKNVTEGLRDTGAALGKKPAQAQAAGKVAAGKFGARPAPLRAVS